MDLLGFYERSSASPAYSEVLRMRAEEERRAVQSRLDEGDFKVGDRVVIRVEGQQMFRDTFTVANGQVLRFPELGELGIRGTLRSELSTRVAEYLERYVRDVRLESISLIRMQFTGAVARPGFHNVPAGTPLGDAIMAAGGPSANADIDNVRVVRRGTIVLAADAVQEALSEGKTLDQLDLRGGDQVVVPERRGGALSSSGLQLLSTLATVVLSMVTLLSIL